MAAVVVTVLMGLLVIGSGLVGYGIAKPTTRHAVAGTVLMVVAVLLGAVAAGLA